MKFIKIKHIAFFIILALYFLKSEAQLIVNTGNTAAWYVQNVLLGGGVTASNITFSGLSNQIGEFNSVNANVGINQGVILATGDVNVAIGPNNSGSSTLGGNGFTPGNDPDLASIVGSGISIYDVAVLEFDFIPQGDTVKFNYVFASEEYLEFVNAGFNDAFGFFLSGPGITGPYSNGAVNIALIPGTTTPVTIDNVNNVTNPAYYIDNGDGFSSPYNSSPQYIQFDGKTVKLTAEYPVTCGLTYHIKIAICDAGDGSYDSGVFLEAGSFSSNLVNLSSNIGISTGDSVLYEGCGIADFLMTRNIVTDSEYVSLTMTGTGVNGTDYTLVPDSVLFLPGDDSITVSINAFNDGISEPLETVTFNLIQTVCNTPDTQSVTFYIADFPNATLTPHDTTFTACVNDSVPVWIDSIPDIYNVLWSTGETSDTIWVTPNATTYYTVTISDTCNVYTYIDSALVTYFSQNSLSISTSPDDYKFCPTDSFTISVTVNSGAGNYSYLWNTGDTSTTINVSPNSTTDYIITVTDLCGQIATDTVTIFYNPYDSLQITTISNDTNICFGSSVNLNVSISGGFPPVLYNWNNGQSITPTIFDTPTDSMYYVITISDRCMTISDSVKVNVWKATTPLSVNVDNDTIFCEADSAKLTAIITGGLFGQRILWNTGDTTNSITVKPQNNTLYSVTVTDTCGNTATTTASVIVQQYPPLTISVSNDTTLKCPEDTVYISANYSGASPFGKYFYWTDGTNLYYDNPLLVNPAITTTYTAFVYDSCAVDSAIAQVTVNIPVIPELLLNTSNDTLICVGDYANLFAYPYSGVPPYSLVWSNGATSNNIVVSPKESTNYMVTATDDCRQEVTATINVSTQSPTADFTYDYLTDVTVSFKDSSYFNIIGWHWTFTAVDTSLQQNPTYSFENPGNHLVTLIVTDDIGCKDTVTKEIFPPLIVYAPNAFTPDNDGNNDTFTLKGLGISTFKMYIFNRWGELLYETDDINKGWDGTYQGEMVPVGVYVWKAVLKGYNNKELEKLGSVNVIR